MNFFERKRVDDTTEQFLGKLKNKMRKKFSKKFEEKKEEEKNMDMDLNKSFDKMNIDEEMAISELQKEPQKLNKKEIQNLNKKEELWRVGIVCKKDCYALTTDILQILEKNGYEWKIISSSYKIKCRKKQNEDSKNFSLNSSSPENTPLNILIQIFGDVDPEQKDEFLVDLHKLSGPVMEFLEFSSIFIASIQKLGLIVLK